MIKGIDSQIVTSRTTDLMRDSSARLKGEQFSHMMQSQAEKDGVEKNIKTVTNVKDRDLRKVDDKDDDAKKQKQQDKDKKEDKKLENDVAVEKKPNSDMNAVSGNETVGYVRRSNLDIEI